MSFSFKGTPIPDYVKVTEVSTSVLPPFSISLSTIEGIVGSKFLRKREESKIFKFSYVIKADSPEDLKIKSRDFANFLSSEKPEKFFLDTEKDKIYYVILSGETPIEQTYGIGTGEFEMIALDPYAEGVTKTVELVSGGTTTINNEGTARTYPIFTITSNINSTAFKMSRWGQNVEKTEFINLYDAIVIGDEIEINNLEGKVTINGENHMQVLSLDSEFFDLAPGTNSLSCSTGFTVSMKYTERWK
jgi:predicted phage tail component-like protein